MYQVLTCNDYITEQSCETLSEAILACIHKETVSNDGFCRVVSHNGRLVADSEGEWQVYNMSAYKRQERSFDAY